MTAYFPVSLDLADKTCVVCGGGRTAERKIRTLLEAGARVVVVAPALSRALRSWRDQSRLKHLARAYREGDLADATLAIAATGDRAINRAIAAEARSAHVLINVVDDPASCDFIAPAVLRRGDLTVSVSTNGRSPAFARWLRDLLAKSIGAEHSTLLDVAYDARQALRTRSARVPAVAWRQALADDLLALILEGKVAAARVQLEARLAACSDGPSTIEPGTSGVPKCQTR